MTGEPDLAFGPGVPRSLWLFALNLKGAEVDRFAARPEGDAPWPLETALGAGPVAAAGIEIVEAGPEPGALARILAADYGASGVPDSAGPVMVVAAAAMGDRAGRFQPAPPLRFLARVPARRARRRKASSDAAMSGRVATVALLVCFAVAGLMVAFSG